MGMIEQEQLRLLQELRDLEEQARRVQLGILEYHDDPVGFARNCINWDDRELHSYQADIMEMVAGNRRAAFRSLRGAGKSACAAITILWFALTREAAGEDWKVVTTAGSWQQLIHFLWPEIHKWSGKLKWDKIRQSGMRFTTTELQKLTLRLTHGEAFAAASSNPGLIEGAHADELLFVFDEAKLIPAGTWDSVEGAMSTGHAYALALSTPGDPAGRFYEICSQKAGYEDWAVKAVTLDEVMAAGQVNEEWIEQRRLQWGENSALYHNHVLGEFFAADEDSVIPLRWAEAAVERWKAWDAAGRRQQIGRRVVACDVARYGTDKTCIGYREGNVIIELQQYAQMDTMQTTGIVKGYTDHPRSLAIIDVIGVGSGVVDRLRELGQETIAFNAAAKAEIAGRPLSDMTGEFGFVNLRAAAWWGLREMLDPSREPELMLPDDPQLLGDLTSPKWKITSGAKYQIESKENIRERLGRSTDMGDTVVMLAWQDGAIFTQQDMEKAAQEWGDAAEDAMDGAMPYEEDLEGMY